MNQVGVLVVAALVGAMGCMGLNLLSAVFNQIRGGVNTRVFLGVIVASAVAFAASITAIMTAFWVWLPVLMPDKYLEIVRILSN